MLTMIKLFADDAWDDYLSWESDKPTHRRINTLVKDIDHHPKGLASEEFRSQSLCAACAAYRPTQELDRSSDGGRGQHVDLQRRYFVTHAVLEPSYPRGTWPCGNTCTSMASARLPSPVVPAFSPS